MLITENYLSQLKEPILQKLLNGDLPTEKEQGKLELLTELQKYISEV